MATIYEVVELADVDEFLSQMDTESTSKMCHQSIVWLAIEIKKNNLSDYNVHMCSGTYAGLDHSWLLVEDLDQGGNYVVDMTLNQFVDCKVPYVGDMTPDYHLTESISLCDESENIRNFVERLGA